MPSLTTREKSPDAACTVVGPAAGGWSVQIRSIIHPALADHVRREAIKFDDELSRAAGLPGRMR
jgi:hypothetical protein